MNPIDDPDVTSIEGPSPSGIQHVPACCHGFQEVFSKGKVRGLLSYRPYDCSINLLPGTTPRNRIYPHSIAEQEAMEEYVQEALQQGYIYPSTSPASTSFFFVEKKGGLPLHRLEG